jgi:hypothetical protein
VTAPVLQRDEKDPQKVNFVINQLGQGRSNAVGEVTLDANATTTTVSAVNCGADSAVFLFPQTANAANDMGLISVDPDDVTQGQFIITHANNARTDRTFWFVCLG